MCLIVSYDVHKDGVKVAVLTFTKSAYRLGETVLGVVQLNTRASKAKVLKVRNHVPHMSFDSRNIHPAIGILGVT